MLGYSTVLKITSVSLVELFVFLLVTENIFHFNWNGKLFKPIHDILTKSFKRGLQTFYKPQRTHFKGEFSVAGNPTIDAEGIL